MDLKQKSKYKNINADDKRVVHPLLKKVLDVDVRVTNTLCNFSNNFLPLRSLRTHYKVLEVSCHGVVIICGWLAFIWLYDSPPLYAMQVNFLLGLLLDIVIIGVVKALVRRRRPPTNKEDMFAAVGPDKFSFPSGHASRAIYMAHFFAHLWPLNIVYMMPIIAWSLSICVSRVLLRRHYLLDVLAGAFIGYLEVSIIGFVWLSQESAAWLVSFVSDDRLEGASYHV